MAIKKLIWIATTAIFATVAGGCASVNPAATALPAAACDLAKGHSEGADASMAFTVIDGRIYTKAMVNDRGPFTFAIDTGASGMGRSDLSLTTALALPKSGVGQTSDGVSTAAVEMVRIDKLDVGGLARTNLDIITRDYNSRMAATSALSGIIGRDFFADGMLVIDYPSRTLSFRRDRTITPGIPGALSYERPFRVPVTLGSVATTGHLDTGANVNFVMPRSLFDQLEATAPQVAGEATLTNNRIPTEIATVKSPIQLGDIRTSDVSVRVSDRFPELMVGSHFLQDYIILIDQRSRQVAICNGPKKPILATTPP